MPKILVVDDEPTQLTILTFAFKRQGYDVICAENGEIAITEAAKEKPDVILMDLMMPKMDGAVATKAIKQDPELSEIPILLYTAYDVGDTAAAAVEAGAAEVIRKTMLPSKLAEKINGYVNRAD